MDDNVNNPSHYNKGKIEVIDFIDDQQFGYNDGNAVKYICRHKHKGNPVEDLKKAIWYLEREIKKLSKKEENQCQHQFVQGSLFRQIMQHYNVMIAIK